MRVLLATVAALAFASVPTAPAEAQSLSGKGFASPHRSFTGVHVGRHDRHDRRDRRDRRRDRRDDSDVVVLGWSDGDWGRYNNRSFEPESYNDWWHERPWRSYPRWVTNGTNGTNGTCDRMWWGGGSWRC